MTIGLAVLMVAYVLAAGLILARGDGSFGLAIRRSVEQFMVLAPRMVLALIAAGFIAKLIPAEWIGRYLGADVGFTSILLACLAGAVIPAGPVVAFAIAAVFALAGASTPALVAFITSWSIFAAHRIFIYELPLLGPSFLRLRLSAVSILPVIAGMTGIGAGWIAALVAGGL